MHAFAVSASVFAALALASPAPLSAEFVRPAIKHTQHNLLTDLQCNTVGCYFPGDAKAQAQCVKACEAIPGNLKREPEPLSKEFVC